MIITSREYFLLLLQLPVYFLIIRFLSKRVQENIRPFFSAAIYAKLAACFLLGIIYQYYYGGAGDTLYYFQHSKFLTNAIVHSPSNFFQYIFSSEEEFANLFSDYINESGVGDYYFHTPNITFIKIAAILNIFSFNSFFGTGFLFCFFSFYGLWKLYILFSSRYPESKMKLIWMFYIPSVVFWSSGILKDAFCMGAIGIIVSSIYKCSLRNSKIILHLLIIAALSYIVCLIKPYIITCIALPIIIWKYWLWIIALTKKYSIKKTIFINIVLLFCIYKFGHIKERVMSISLEDVYAEVIKTRLGFESSTEDSGSSFSLGEFTPTVGGFIQQLPLAVNAVLFRPYVWETKKIFSLIAALESIAFFIFSVIVLFKTGIILTLKKCFLNPDIFFCFFFTVLFAAALGMSITNFGALVRFKIQFMPFFVIGLVLIYTKKEKELVTIN